MMDYHELIDALTAEDNPNVLDYIDDAVEMLEHLHSELAAANARCETLIRLLTEYQDELIPGYRERAERAERERDAAIEDCSGYCATCTFLFDCAKHDMNDAAQPRWYYGDCQDWEWRGIQEDKL